MKLAVATARDQARGFDCNLPLTDADCAAFKAHGYDFAIRYVPRSGAPNHRDLTPDEAHELFDAGLALMCVQHVESETAWIPTELKGHANGNAAASYMQAVVGLPSGSPVWCDLEGVADGVSADEVIAYAHAWFDAVKIAGMCPGLYVGYHSRLTPEQLYRLPFEHYWAAGNLNQDELPAKRGVQMHQWWRHPSDVPAGIDFEFDVNTILADKLGGLPSWVVPA